MSSSPPLVLTFAASDPTGGAGLQADVLKLASLGCHPLSVVTALTVQDTSGVEQLEAVDAELVRRQASRLLAESRVAAFKLGVLGSEANVRAIAQVVADHPRVPLVLDPVLASGRGDALASEPMIEAQLELIVPRATLVTPNSLEARRLGGEKGLLERGCHYVLVTGTHEPGAEVINRLFGPQGLVREDRSPRLPGSYHGSGRTLASAIPAAPAGGLDVPAAVRGAHAYAWQVPSSGVPPRQR